MWMIEIKTTPAGRVDVTGLMPMLSHGVTPSELAAQRLWMGNEQIAAGDLFWIRSSRIGNGDSVWQGDFSKIDGIGSGHFVGGIKFYIDGDVGRRLGAGFEGALIHVTGNASDEVGLGMRLGTIIVGGNAGHRVGAAAPGERCGMRNGFILVGQSCGNELGTGMRRSAIGVGGSVGDQAGGNMQSGTIAIGGSIGNSFGIGMRRGTIICGRAIEEGSIPISFSESVQLETTIPTMLGKWLRRPKRPLPATFLMEMMESNCWRLRHGDRLTGGRGELLTPR